MSSIQTPEVPADQAASAPNLQKDPETGEMVSKRCTRLAHSSPGVAVYSRLLPATLSELKKRIKARENAKKKAEKVRLASLALRLVALLSRARTDNLPPHRPPAPPLNLLPRPRLPTQRRSSRPTCVSQAELTCAHLSLTRLASRPQQYYEIRSRAIQKLRAIPNAERTLSTPNPYPHKFHVTVSIPTFIEKYGSSLKEAGSRSDEVVSVAGRIHSMRAQGAKLRFYDLWSEGVKIQVMANAKCASLVPVLVCMS